MISIIDKKPILVAGVGNSIQMDDGGGIHVLWELQKLTMPDDVDLLDGGTLGIDILPWIEGRKKLLVIDAVDANAAPGTIFRFEPEVINYTEVPKTSIHQFGLIDALQMAALSGKAPEKTVIYGVQPERIDWGESLSPDVQAAVPKVINLIMTEIRSSIIQLRKEILMEDRP